MQTLAKFIYFRILGWRLQGTFPKVDKCVIIVAPHTSWVDFFIGILVRKLWNEEINFIGKQSLFKPPFGWYFKWMGGAPIDRSKNNDMVKAIAKIFSERNTFRLALAPEGTRKRVSAWKTGYYYIAQAANVPIVMVAFDYGSKQVKISDPYPISSFKEGELEKKHEFFNGVVGKVPEYS
ncbi:1-acyl-sn-glycerol-3-phosphate acyltransferase [Spongiimicrobium salis]|uniref:1-acyl-sn-glycerol-3-phosphate acyltransferase n=1 Tax=Spongiimicrobium salis TaxID=1667022 RepID=UPI00374CD663